MTIGRCCFWRRHHGVVKRGAPSPIFFLWRAMQGWVKLVGCWLDGGGDEV